MVENLSEVRKDIDELDQQILKLLADRREISQKVAQCKVDDAAIIRDQKREKKLLGGLIDKGKELGLDSFFVNKMFGQIIEDSVQVQQKYFQESANQSKFGGQRITTVAFRGSEGTAAQLAGKKYFGDGSSTLSFTSCPGFKGVLDEVENGKAEYAIVPVEHSATGGITVVHDLLLQTSLSWVGEIKYDLSFCLAGKTDTEFSGVQKIICAPEALNYCQGFLSENASWHVEVAADEVKACNRVKETKGGTAVCICSSQAAELTELEVLKDNVLRNAKGYTRFAVIARNAVKVDSRICCKTSMVISTAQQPGSLAKALMIFQQYGIVLTRLESRAVPDNPEEEMFYIDFAGNIESEPVMKAMDELTRSSRFIKVLGCYPSDDVPPAAGTEAVASRIESGRTESKALKNGKIKVESKERKIPKGYKLVSRAYKEEDTVIKVGKVLIGGDNFTMIAGPCAVESFEQIHECARVAKATGVHILRGGCFKPRTSPYSFQGLGFEGVDMLVAVGKEFDIPVVTEVLSTHDVERVAEKVDILQIGARNMQNFTLLSEVGKTRRPVFLKRGMSSSIDELLHAAEYIASQGNQQIILCERGIRTFETATRNTLDISAVPVLQEMTHLPIVCDPSHAAGRRDLIKPLSVACRSVGAHGLMVEFHPEPEKAMSDGPQSLTPELMQDLMEVLFD